MKAWEEYIRDIPRQGAFEALSQRLVQLSFPIQEGMSTNPNYQLACRKGLATRAMKTATGTHLEEPSDIKV